MLLLPTRTTTAYIALIMVPTGLSETKESAVHSILKEKFADFPFIWNYTFPQDINCALAKYRPVFLFHGRPHYN